ncbi:unnamed protein product [Echinostoma caproni]|uniref:RRP7 domain-containing protein n=1 Tax=Echinostoma caproni TaxID=27848 RepID=A0A183ACA9_9TREM|nr:unnamed protein product [Echinostoma caproni]
MCSSTDDDDDIVEPRDLNDTEPLDLPFSAKTDNQAVVVEPLTGKQKRRLERALRKQTGGTGRHFYRELRAEREQQMNSQAPDDTSAKSRIKSKKRTKRR